MDIEIIRNKNFKPFESDISELTFLRTYSRLKDNGNKETWEETVFRYISFIQRRLNIQDIEKLQEVYNAILKGEVMPSMRLMQYAGKVIDKNEISAYNCSFLKADSINSLSEILYLNMSGVGIGFSVEEKIISKFPPVTPLIENRTLIKNKKFIFPVPDSTEGWVIAYKIYLRLRFSGYKTEFDTSKIRKKNSKISRGGFASGPEGFLNIIKTTEKLLMNAEGRKLRSVEILDLICEASNAIFAGAARRVALISLSDLKDGEMRDAKKGEFWIENPNRRFANNSVKYYKKPSREDFNKEWTTLKENKSGERGIFNAGSLERFLPIRRKRISLENWGLNPCGEIQLRHCQFCNLSEAVLRFDDNFETVKNKIRIAAIIGTWQSTFTNFNERMLRPLWRKNCEEERLLGISMTGIADCSFMLNNLNFLEDFKNIAIKTNLEESKVIGIKPSAAITCIKPSGTVSTIMDSSPGLHPRFSEYYIRRVRFHEQESEILTKAGFKIFKESEDSIYIEFLIKSPKNSWIQKEKGAISQLNLWKQFKECFCEHNPSMTCYIRENEWDEVEEWLFNNWDFIGGLSFLPYSDHVYKAAPFEPISEERYLALLNEQKSKNWFILYNRGQDTRFESKGCDNQSN